MGNELPNIVPKSLQPRKKPPGELISQSFSQCLCQLGQSISHCLPVCLSVFVPTSLVYPPVCLSVCLPARLPACLSVRPPACLTPISSCRVIQASSDMRSCVLLGRNSAGCACMCACPPTCLENNADVVSNRCHCPCPA